MAAASMGFYERSVGTLTYVSLQGRLKQQSPDPTNLQRS